MATSEVNYIGHLRTSATHLASGTIIETDAPVDNHGKGERFSPTDLVATAYASCMLTIIGIFCQEHGYSFENGKAKVTKIMATEPRRIGEIVIDMDLRGNGWDELTFEKVIRAAKACPVAQSVHAGMTISLTFRKDV